MLRLNAWAKPLERTAPGTSAMYSLRECWSPAVQLVPTQPTVQAELPQLRPGVSAVKVKVVHVPSTPPVSGTKLIRQSKKFVFAADSRAEECRGRGKSQFILPTIAIDHRVRSKIMLYQSPQTYHIRRRRIARDKTS
mmetsp:Transcript_20382/g.33311  ORF Transcript_20382/g.33311 Transcript_20382/m.33311 type:complete len:137 (-) Transcript_20382:602-1012(-)